MKTNYLLQPRKKQSRKAYKTIGIAVVLFVFVFLLNILFPKAIPSMYGWIAVPALRGEEAVSAVTPVLSSMVRSKRSIIVENLQLKQEMEAVRLNMLAFDSVVKENTELKEMLGRKNTDRLVVAAILARPPETLYDTILLDAGSEEGIVKGSKVIVASTTSIGEVVEVRNHQSIASLYSAPAVKNNVLIGKNNISAVAEGKGGGNFEIKVPKDVVVNVGDAVVAPALSTSVYGTVEKVLTKPADSFQYVLFKTPINIADVRFVGIEIK